MKQYLPKKPTKRGFKIWVRADSHNGFFCNFEVYVGKSAEGREHGLGGSVVLRMSENITGKNYHLFCNNFFTSSKLLQRLLQLKLYCCGTTNATRKGFPAELKSVALNRGEHRYMQCNNLVATVWMDKRPVSTLSTLSPPDETQLVRRKEKDGTMINVSCPHSIVIYNKFMGGVDRGDQMRQYYCVRLKSYKNYKYIFWFAFEVCIGNAYILSKFSPNASSALSHRHLKNFRLRLAEELIGSYCTKKRAGRPRTSLTPLPPRVAISHLPARNDKRTTCQFCKAPHYRRQTQWYCPDCTEKPALCLTGYNDGSCCYRRWHTQRAT